MRSPVFFTIAVTAWSRFSLRSGLEAADASRTLIDPSCRLQRMRRVSTVPSSFVSRRWIRLALVLCQSSRITESPVIVDQDPTSVRPTGTCRFPGGAAGTTPATSPRSAARVVPSGRRLNSNASPLWPDVLRGTATRRCVQHQHPSACRPRFQFV